MEGEEITSRKLAETIRMTEDMVEIFWRHCLRWIRHVARMNNTRMSEQLLTGEPVRSSPSNGRKRRWRDLAASDL